jgi:hypothetical protein
MEEEQQEKRVYPFMLLIKLSCYGAAGECWLAGYRPSVRNTRGWAHDAGCDWTRMAHMAG